MSLIEIYEDSLTGKVKVNYQYKASKIWYTKGRVPIVHYCTLSLFDMTQGKIDLRNESGRPMKVKVVGEVSEK